MCDHVVLCCRRTGGQVKARVEEALDDFQTVLVPSYGKRGAENGVHMPGQGRRGIAQLASTSSIASTASC